MDVAKLHEVSHLELNIISEYLSKVKVCKVWNVLTIVSTGSYLVSHLYELRKETYPSGTSVWSYFPVFELSSVEESKKEIKDLQGHILYFQLQQDFSILLLRHLR